MGERRPTARRASSSPRPAPSSAEAAAQAMSRPRLRAIGGRRGDRPEEALAGLVCFVCASYDTARFASEIAAALPGAPIYGCTTAGELTPAGWASHSVVAIGFLRKNFTLVAHMLENLSHFGVEEGRASISEARAALMAVGSRMSSAEHCFGLLLIDGMCRREEAVISALYSALDDIAVVGGSAGDGMSFEKTWMIRDGDIYRDAALLLLFHTDLPFAPFKCDYFEPTALKMVVTDADTELRVVRELNAEPAATEYAHQVGLVESSLDASSFASHPVLVGVGGQYYARSIQKVNADGSLSFFCAIDEGLVLTVAKSLDPYESTLATFERMEAELGAVSLYIGFDCVLRRLGAERSQIAHRLSDLYRAPPRHRLQHLWRAISLDARKPDFHRHCARLPRAMTRGGRQMTCRRRRERRRSQTPDRQAGENQPRPDVARRTLGGQPVQRLFAVRDRDRARPSGAPPHPGIAAGDALDRKGQKAGRGGELAENHFRHLGRPRPAAAAQRRAARPVGAGRIAETGRRAAC